MNQAAPTTDRATVTPSWRAQLACELWMARMGILKDGDRVLGQMLFELAKVDDWYGEDTGQMGFPPYPYKLCESGCGCRYGTKDADAQECACDGPCTRGDTELWFVAPLIDMARYAIKGMLTLLHHAEDPAQAGMLLLQETQVIMRNMVQAKVTYRRSGAQCPFTHPHTRNFCGYPDCRSS